MAWASAAVVWGLLVPVVLLTLLRWRANRAAWARASEDALPPVSSRPPPADPPADPWTTVEVLQRTVFPRRGWVLFRHGTYVVFTAKVVDQEAEAVAILKEWGPVHVGSAAGDFGVVALVEAPGWVVTGQHPDVATYVAPEEVPGARSDLRVGMFGRAKRGLDAEEREVVHVEAWR